MDAIKYLNAASRMCAENMCSNCPLESLEYTCPIRYSNAGVEIPQKIVEIVENWEKNHPAKTRQSEFLKMFPNADLKIITRLLPCAIDSDMKPLRCAEYGYLSITCRCDRCRDDYWNEEVSE